MVQDNKPPGPKTPEQREGDRKLEKPLFRYRRLWASIVISTCLVSLLPLIVMVVVNYYQYQKAFEEEVKHPIRLIASNAESSLEFIFYERLSALDFIIQDKAFEALTDQPQLTRIFRILKKNHADFVDIGVIDAEGNQRSYVGPYGLRNKNYKDQDWFKATLLQGHYISDVFMGYRQYPHLAIAVRNISDQGEAYILRATMNADILERMREAEGIRESRDTFVINRKGVLQTSSKYHGKILEQTHVPISARKNGFQILEKPDKNDRVRVIGYAAIKKSPFIYIVLELRDTLLTSWFSLRNQLIWFLVVSVIVILIVILVGSSNMVNRIREADNKRLEVLHKVEYTSKMASIGRLAAGVAHEINNPLAIINEKAGLLKDLLQYAEDSPQKEKLLKNIEPILNSIERCARITRRLLSFAKHMDIRREQIDLESLISEVLGFLEKDATYRNLTITVVAHPGVSMIESDRGRLQQVFLNIINNAFGAVEDGGRIHILIAQEGDNHISVTIRDNGMGIPPEHLNHIFEPFFTTKEKHGTGLGLSITYGIIEKLGGKITVDSQVGEWTKFAVILPIKPDFRRSEDGTNASSVG